MTRSAGPTPGSSADEVPDADPASFARAILLRQLTVGPRTRAQLQEALHKRNVPPDIGAQLLERFEEVGLIDDRAYADALIRSEASAGGLSRRRVQQRLRLKGVPQEITATAVDSISAEAEEAAAVGLAQRRASRMHGLDPATARRRLTGILARRGYRAETVRRAVAAVLEERDGAAEGEQVEPL